MLLVFAGKLVPETLLYAAEQLGVMSKRAVDVEDARSGVRAGHQGGFGLVVGLDRHCGAQALLDDGADLVIADLRELMP